MKMGFLDDWMIDDGFYGLLKSDLRNILSVNKNRLLGRIITINGE